MRYQRTRGEKEDGDHRGYRTHLIFAGKRDPEAATGSSGGGASSAFFGGHSSSHPLSHSNHPFAQAQSQIRLPPHEIPLPRRPSARPSTNLQVEEDYYSSRAGQSRQVSFSGAGGGGGVWGQQGQASGPQQFQGPPSYYNGVGGPGGPSSSAGASAYYEDPSGKPGMLEVVAGLSRDCFIIPLACVDRFLPAGLTLPDITTRSNNNSNSGSGGGTPLNVLEVADPQLAVVIHLMTPLIPLSQPMDASGAQPERLQRILASELIERAKMERQAAHGLLLASMETGSDFPLMALYVVPKLRTDAANFLEQTRRHSLDIFDPGTIGHCGDSFFHLCREVATIARPPPETAPKNPGPIPPKNATGYIISIFRVFDGDDKEKLERNWLYWTGARTLYRHLPKSVGLRRITLHKSAALRGDKLYLLLCECSNFLENVNSAAQLLPALRARLCGYTGIYRIAHAF